MKTYSIPQSNFEVLCQRLEKLTRWAKKIGKKVPQLVKIGEHSEIVDQKKGLSRTYYDVTIESEPVCVDNWDFIAKIELGDPEVGLVISRVPGVLEDIDIPLEYRKTTNYCTHCKKNVRRNSVFIVRHQITGEWAQIGRQCLSLYLGGTDPEDIVKYMEMLIDLDGICQGAGDPNFFGFGRDSQRLDLESTLNFVGFTIKNLGWLSRSKSRELAEQDIFKSATADIVQSVYFTPEKDQSQVVKTLVADYEQIDEVEKAKLQEETEKALLWIRSTDDENNSDYLHNLLVCCSGETFDRKHIGIVASLLIAHQNTLGRLEDLKNRQNQAVNLRHVGTVGKRETFDLTVKQLHSMQSQWGSKTGVFFEDKDSNRITWWAAGNPDVEIGSTYQVVASVKSHDSYQGIPQTTITRAKVAGAVGQLN